MEAPSSIGPYQVTGTLGAGGMGVVHRAAHPVTGQAVAVKTVRASRAGHLAAIRREIQALARLDHPNVARVLDHGLQDGRPWVAMELIEGESLAERTRSRWQGFSDTGLSSSPTLHLDDLGEGDGEAPEPPSTPPPAAAGDLPWLLDLARALCDTLAWVHGEGVVHRDLKPANVLLPDEGEPVLVDFGVMASLGTEGREVLESTGAMGTLGFMAPELLEGAPVDARADLYSVGCLLYEGLTGRLPYVARSARELRFLIGDAEPTPPSELVDGLPEGLEAIVLRLLAADPEDRFGHAADASRALADLGAAPSRHRATHPPRPYLYRAPFAGREGVLDTLLVHLDGPADEAMLVRGPSGAGKTRLLVEFSREARRRGATVLTLGCRQDGEDALEPVRPLLQGLADRLGDAATADQVLGDHRPVLGFVEPALRYGEPPPPVEPLPPAAARARVLGAVRVALTVLVGDATAVLLADDLQWADDLTLDVVAEIAPEVPGLHVVGAARTETLPTALEPLRTVSLGRLGDAAVRRVVGGMLAAEPPHDLAAFLVEHAGGNPFFVGEYLRAAVDADLLVRDAEGGWRTERDIEHLPLPDTLGALIDRRLRGLSVRLQRLAGAAAITGRVVDLALLEAMHDEPVGGEVAGLIDAAILEEHQGAIRFVHDQLRERAQEILDAERRAALHRRAARILEERGEGDEAAMRIAAHWMEGLRDPSADLASTRHAVRALTRAGVQGLRAGAYGDVIAPLEQARRWIRHLPEDAERDRLAFAVYATLGPARATRNFGDPSVKELYDRALELAPEAASREAFTALWGLWIYFLMRGIGVGSDLAARLREMARELDDVDLLLEARHASWAVTVLQGRFRESLEHGRVGRELYDHERHPHLAHRFGGHDPWACSLYSSADCWLYLGRIDRCRTALDEALAAAERVDQPSTRVVALMHGSLTGWMAEEPAWVERYLGPLAEHARTFDLPLYKVLSGLWSAWLDARRDDADAAAERAAALTEKLGGMRVMAFIGEHIEVEALRRAGRLQAARNAARAIPSLCASVQLELVLPMAHLQAARIDAALGDEAAALEHLGAGLEVARRDESRFYEVLLHAERVDLVPDARDDLRRALDRIDGGDDLQAVRAARAKLDSAGDQESPAE